jgi:hypothetical protein
VQQGTGIASCSPFGDRVGVRAVGRVYKRLVLDICACVYDLYVFTTRLSLHACMPGTTVRYSCFLRACLCLHAYLMQPHAAGRDARADGGPSAHVPLRSSDSAIELGPIGALRVSDDRALRVLISV